MPWNTGPASRGIVTRHGVESARPLQFRVPSVKAVIDDRLQGSGKCLMLVRVPAIQLDELI